MTPELAQGPGAVGVPASGSRQRGSGPVREWGHFVKQSYWKMDLTGVIGRAEMKFSHCRRKGRQERVPQPVIERLQKYI